MDIVALDRFIVEAKRQTYVGDGVKAAASRMGAHDLTYTVGDWSYRDSYFGGTDFLGQETVWLRDEPVWAMNYYGYILRPDLIDAGRAGATIKAALSVMYAEGRFLGGFEWRAHTASIATAPLVMQRISMDAKRLKLAGSRPTRWTISADW
jgi:hypothetical protein